MTFLETLRTGGAPILTREMIELASRNQVGSLREPEEPGWGFGYLSGVLVDPERAESPASAGTLSWGGVYGHSWFQDPVAELSVVGLTNTAVEGCMGSFPGWACWRRSTPSDRGAQLIEWLDDVGSKLGYSGRE